MDIFVEESAPASCPPILLQQRHNVCVALYSVVRPVRRNVLERLDMFPATVSRES